MTLHRLTLIAGVLLLPVALHAQPSATQRAPLPAAVADSGAIDGAPYTIAIPKDWNGGLVVFTHGYEMKGGPHFSKSANNGSLRQLFTARGFAYAASDYRAQGWAVGEGIDDTEALRQYFVKTYGRPDSTYIAGQSMGGHIAIAAFEAHQADYVGALPMCGPLTPATAFFNEGFFEGLVAFEYFFPNVLTKTPLGLADPAAPPFVAAPVITAALQANPAGTAAFVKRFNARPADLPGVMAFYYVMLHEMVQRAGGLPLDNSGTVYRGYDDDAAFNRGVRRYTAAPAAAAWLRERAAPTGRISKPVLTITTTHDPIVEPVNINRYAAMTALQGNGDKFLAKFVVADGHCAMGPTAIGTAFDELRHWVATGQRPAAGEIAR